MYCRVLIVISILISMHVSVKADQGNLLSSVGQEVLVPEFEPDKRYWVNNVQLSDPLSDFFSPENSDHTEYPCLAYDQYKQEWYFGRAPLIVSHNSVNEEPSNSRALTVKCYYKRERNNEPPPQLDKTLRGWSTFSNARPEGIFFLKNVVVTTTLSGYLPKPIGGYFYTTFPETNSALCAVADSTRPGKYEFGVVHDDGWFFSSYHQCHIDTRRFETFEAFLIPLITSE